MSKHLSRTLSHFLSKSSHSPYYKVSGLSLLQQEWTSLEDLTWTVACHGLIPIIVLKVAATVHSGIMH